MAFSIYKIYSEIKKLSSRAKYLLSSDSADENDVAYLKKRFKTLKSNTPISFREPELNLRLKALEKLINRVKCQVCSSVVLSLQNFLNTDTPSYPVGVFNLNGTYIGIANNQTEYIALWNADVDNQTQGLLKPGINAFTFKLPSTASIDKVIGLRWYQFNVAANRMVRVCLDTSDVIVAPDGQINGSTGTFLSRDSLVGTQFSSQPRAIFGSNAITRTYVLAGTVYVFHNDSANPSGFLSSAVFSGGNGGTSALSGVFPKNTTQVVISPNTPTEINPTMISNWAELTSVQSLSCLYWVSGNVNLTNTPLFHHMTQLRLFTTFFGGIPLTSWGVCDQTLFPNIESLGFTFGVSVAPVGNWSNISPTIKYVALGGGAAGQTTADTEHIAVSLANQTTNGPATINSKAIQFGTGYTAAALVAKNTLISKGYTVSP